MTRKIVIINGKENEKESRSENKHTNEVQPNSKYIKCLQGTVNLILSCKVGK